MGTGTRGCDASGARRSLRDSPGAEESLVKCTHLTEKQVDGDERWSVRANEM